MADESECVTETVCVCVCVVKCSVCVSLRGVISVLLLYLNSVYLCAAGAVQQQCAGLVGVLAEE